MPVYDTILPTVRNGYRSAQSERSLEQIKTVFDPEIPVDIYELGLIYEAGGL
jgi:metal-sulfur cluster biosynthetic enzyme